MRVIKPFHLHRLFLDYQATQTFDVVLYAHDALCLLQARTDVYYIYFNWFRAVHGYLQGGTTNGSDALLLVY